MKLHILSDLHTEFAPFEWPGTSADVVILAGDTGVGKRGLEWALRTIPETPVIYVTGNHEYYGQKIPKLVNELRQLAAGSNVRVLENDAAILGDFVFLGATLWTDFALDGNVPLATADAVTGMSDFQRIRVSSTYRRFHPRDATTRPPCIGLLRPLVRFLEKSWSWSATTLRVGARFPLGIASTRSIPPTPQILNRCLRNLPPSSGFTGTFITPRTTSLARHGSSPIRAVIRVKTFRDSTRR